MLNFQLLLHDIEIPPDVLYYFKPIASFRVSGMSEDEKFEDIDGYIAEEFGCDLDDIFTMSSKQGPVIVMSEAVLLRSRVKLPRWPERNATASRAKARNVAALHPR
jgi:hypothetical protein